MPRPLRIQFSGALYHVMNRGLNRQKIFLDPKDHQNFLAIIEQAYEHWQVKVYAYGLMENHYHLCVGTPEGKLSRIMRHINGVYTQRFNHRHKREGPLFRGRYKAVVIEKEYLDAVVRYIHHNPVEAKLCTNPTAFRWSSHAAYLGKSKSPAWLDRRPVISRFRSRHDFHRYVLEGDSEEIRTFYAKKKQPIALGGKGFLQKLYQRVDQAPERHSEHYRLERQLVRPPIEVIIEMVAKYYQLDPEEVRTAKRGQENRARKMAIALAHRYSDATYRDLAAPFGGVNPRTIAWACGSFKCETAENRTVRREYEDLRKRLEATTGQQ